MAEEGLRRHEVTKRPFNAETPLAALAQPQTPLDLVYVRNHFDIPKLDSESWKLEVGGAVAVPLNLSLSDLQEMAAHSVEMVLECAGNGRKMMDPKPPGTPWNLGAVSRVQFRGVPLRRILAQAVAVDEAIEVLFKGADAGEVAAGRREPFARSLPLGIARSEDVLLAWQLNGEPLPPQHGWPLRLVVPGWYGMASVKWITSITVLTRPFKGFFQSEHYVYQEEAGTPALKPVRRIRPRALILSPQDQVSLPLSRTYLQGVAWSGYGPIAQVLVSDDGGSSWLEAELEPEVGAHSMQRWQLPWHPPRVGQFEISVRAIDGVGNAQPESSRWNRLGYGNNGPHSITVMVG